MDPNRNYRVVCTLKYSQMLMVIQIESNNYFIYIAVFRHDLYLHRMSSVIVKSLNWIFDLQTPNFLVS